eukprot:1188645-Prorocentrum_minimum.AAC.12
MHSLFAIRAHLQANAPKAAEAIDRLCNKEPFCGLFGHRLRHRAPAQLRVCHSHAAPRARSLRVTLVSRCAAGALSARYACVTLRRGRALCALRLCHAATRARSLRVTLVSRCAAGALSARYACVTLRRGHRHRSAQTAPFSSGVQKL